MVEVQLANITKHFMYTTTKGQAISVEKVASRTYDFRMSRFLCQDFAIKSNYFSKRVSYQPRP